VISKPTEYGTRSQPFSGVSYTIGISVGILEQVELIARKTKVTRTLTEKEHDEIAHRSDMI